MRLYCAQVESLEQLLAESTAETSLATEGFSATFSTRTILSLARLWLSLLVQRI